VDELNDDDDDDDRRLFRCPADSGHLAL